MSEIIARVVGAIGVEISKMDMPCSVYVTGSVARAAIEARREPTPELIKAGWSEFYWETFEQNDIIKLWQAMIGGALRTNRQHLTPHPAQRCG